MFYYFSESEDRIIVKRAELTFVPIFEQLRSEFGWNALQYMFYFSAASSPFVQKKDKEVRHRNVMDAIRKNPWDNTNKLLPKAFYDEPVFIQAETEFKEHHEDQDELEEINIISESRRMVMKQIREVSSRREMEIIDFVGAINACVKQKVDAHFKANKKSDPTKLFQEITAATGDIIGRSFAGLTPLQMKELKTLLDQLSSLSKHHNDVKNKAKDRVKADEAPSIIFGEHE
ncbi:MAG TPA: hypothetical protein VGB67_10240 [Fibrella sp.]|jgi:hypothetical protein